MKSHIKTGDTVRIVAGKDRGKTGKVTRVLRGAGRIVVDGVNQYKKHRKPRTANERGEVVTVARSLDESNAMVYCTTCARGVRVGFRTEGVRKVRYCRRCKASLG